MILHLFFRFAYAHWLYLALPFLILISFIRRYYTHQTLYQYSLVSYITTQHTKVSLFPVYILNGLRFLILIIMLILIAKPQLVDQKSKITVEGIDIMMVLDVSGSMIALFDDLKDPRSRLTIAKQEAVRFVDKRHNDAIGLVIFGSYAMTSCPLTLDKTILKSMINAIPTSHNKDSIHDGTVIAQALMTASRRLQKSQTQSKIIILLTDGESTHDFPIEDAIEVAQSFGIKVYTIGIGNHGTSFSYGPFGPIQQATHFNSELLEKVAYETGGKFFDAKKSQDVARIYDEIDRLEKSKYQSDVYTKYYDYFIPIVLSLLFLIFFELIISIFIWAIL